MQPISTARSFFDDMVSGGATTIENLVSIQQQETEWLDFKADGHANDNKRNWSEALSAFGNTQGGVIVWGIDARKDPATGIDAACSIKTISNPAAFRSRLAELLRQSVDPPLPGVEIVDVLSSQNDGSGFVLCYVPEGQSKPYRAEHTANKPFMFRVSDSFQVLPTSLLKSMFYPRATPALEIVVYPEWAPVLQDGSYVLGNVTVYFKIYVKNVGTVSARDVAMIVNVTPEPRALKAVPGVDEMQSDAGKGFSISRPLHPSSITHVCNAKIDAGLIRKFGNAKLPVRPALELVDIQIDIFAADTQPLELGVALGGRDIEMMETRTACNR